MAQYVSDKSMKQMSTKRKKKDSVIWFIRKKNKQNKWNERTIDGFKTVEVLEFNFKA